MSCNVRGYASRVYGYMVGSGYNGSCTVTFYSPNGVFPTCEEVRVSIMEKVKYSRALVGDGVYNSSLMYYCEARETTEENAICDTILHELPNFTFARQFTIFRSCMGGVLVVEVVAENIFKDGKYNSTLMLCDKLFSMVLGNDKIQVATIPVVQMDSAQGEITQHSDHTSNTIITRDNDVSIAEEGGIVAPTLREICSTEDEFRFDSIVNRWMALDLIKVSTNNPFNSMLKVYNLPKFLYRESFAPNLMPFQNFMYGNYNIEFKFVVNANKFHVGKIVCAVKYDSYQVDGIRNDVVDLLSRPHVILDLSSNNEGVLSVPFKYHRTYVRNASATGSNYGIKDAQYATINVVVLSPLKAVAGAPTKVDIRPFYRIKEASFTGMSFSVPVVQMEAAIGNFVLEKSLKYIGRIFNKDKPIDLQRQAQYIPKPRMNFATGKGASDVNPIKIDPATLTTYLDDHVYPEDPQTTLDIARIWGFVGKFEWGMDQAEGTLLYSQAIDPTWRISDSYKGVPTPLEYISSMYQFWSGPLELRLDFVSNAFHTGSIMISAEFGRSGGTIEQSSSSYTKVFHLGEQRTVTFVIPYIFDTVWRRTQCVPFCPIKTDLAGGNWGYNAVLRTLSSKVNIRIVNALVPIASVTPSIDVLVFIRGGENFTLHSPIMPNLFNSEVSYKMDNFPGDYPKQISANSLRQFTPQLLEGKTGKEMRSYWESLLPAPEKENPSPDVLKPDVVLKEASPIDIGQRELDRENAKRQRLLANLDSNSGLANLAAFQERHKKFNSGYKHDHYKFHSFNNGHIVFTINDGSPLVADLQSQSIYDKKVNQWLDWPAYHALHKDFHGNALTNMLLHLKLTELPNVQMDQGEISNVDPTATFGQGINRSVVQTIESHVNIKDLLRRPVLMMYNTSVPAFGGVNYYYVPCMPPSHMMALLGDGANGPYCANLSRSYHVHLMDMFRFWRGCQRWTIVVRNTTDVVYVSYVPHSGARLIGNLTYGNVVGGSAPVGGFGLGTEMIVPTVNPTHVIETPFELENNWALVFSEQANRNYSWRDKGDTNSGHLVFWSQNAFQMDLWWAAGDDFAVSNFLGVPPCINGIRQYYMSDNYPVVQMDYVSNMFSGISTSAVCNALPLFGASVAVGSTCYKANRAITKLNDTTAEIGDRITEVLSGVAEKHSWGSNMVKWMSDLFFDFILCFSNWNITTLCVTILRTLGNMLSLSLSTVMSFTSSLVEVFSEGVATQAMEPEDIISGPYWTDSKIGKIVGIFIGLIGLATGTHYGTPSDGFITKCGKMFSDFRSFSYLNHVIRFVESVFSLIMDCVRWCCAQTNVEVQALQTLQNRNDFLSDFVKECSTLMDEANAGMFGNPAFKMRFWRQTIRARQIQQQIVKLPTNQVSVVLSKMCGDMIRKANEKMCDLRSSPIKYEPLVICISGPSNVGKSTLVRHLAPKLLRAMGIEGYSSDPIYTRMQSSRFWNTYVDQPIVLIDEWLNISEPNILAQAINELYMLKSCATFIPEQAAIEDKKARASPKIVILLCNNAFPRFVDSIAPNLDAVFRRRDIMIHVDRKPDYAGVNLRNMSVEDKTKCAHLQGQFYANSCDPESLGDEIFSFEQFSDKIADFAKKYNEQELENVKIQFGMLQKQCGINMGTLEDDPFAIFYNNLQTVHLQAHPNLLPSEQLEAYLQVLLDRVQDVVIDDGNNDPTPVLVPEVQGIVEDLKDGLNTIKQKIVETKDEVYAWLRKNLITTLGLQNEVATCSMCGCATRGAAICNAYVRTGPHDPWGDERFKETGFRPKNHVYCDFCMKSCFDCGLVDMLVKKFPRFGQCKFCQGAVYPVVPGAVNSAIHALYKYRNRRDIVSLMAARYSELCNNPFFLWFMANLSVMVVAGALSYIADLTLPHNPRPMVFHFNPKDAPLVQMTDDLVTNHNKYEGHRLGGVEPPIREVNQTRVHNIEKMITYSFNMRGYKQMQKELISGGEKMDQTTPLPHDWQISMDLSCIHYFSYDNAELVRYENKKFVVIYDFNYVPMPSKPCHDKCAWQWEEFRLMFCKKFFDVHMVSLRPIITRESHYPEWVKNARDKHPAFMFPPWAHEEELVKQDEGWFENLSLHPTLKSILKKLGMVLVGVGMLKGLSWLFSKIRGVGPELQASNFNASGSDIIRHFKSDIRKPGRTSNIQPQSLNVEDSVIEKIVQNYITIYVYTKDGTLWRTLTGIGMKQRIALIPRHYYNWLVENNTNVDLKLGRTNMPQHQIAYKFDEVDFIISSSSDIAVFYMPASCNLFKNIVKYVFQDKDYEQKRSSHGILVKVPKKDTSTFFQLDIDLKGYKPECTVNEGGTLQTFKHLLEYNYSEGGACGSVVLCKDKQRPIMAMHIAGAGDKFAGTGYGVLLSQEMLSDIPGDPISTQAEEVEELVILDDLDKAKICLPLESVVTPLGVLPPDKTPFTPYVSKIKPSLISDILPWPTTREPAILSKKDPRYEHEISPLIAGCAKHGYLTKDFKSSQLEEVKLARMAKIMRLNPLVAPTIKLTYEEAVGGLDHMEYYDTMHLDTSAGWPWCCSGHTLKKNYCMVEKDDTGCLIRVVIDKTIINEVKRKEDLRRQGIVPATIFVDTLKDEKKEHHKIKKLGGTRVFCASPFDYTISMRQHFLHFVAAYMYYRHDFDNAIGINVNGSETTKLVRNLLSKGDKIVTIDYSNFGPGFNAGVAANVKYILIQWTLENVKDCNLVEMSCLLEEGINSIHCMHNYVYQQRGGSPSGSPITVVINSEVNVQYIYLAWLNLCNIKENIWREFEENVCLYVYGDDLIMSVSDKFIDRFNGVTIQHFFQEYDIVSTNASKDLEVKPYETIYEAQFLKKTFDHHPKHRLEWIAKTNMSSVLDCPHWIQENLLKSEATRLNAESCLHEAYGHGEAKFNELLFEINRALKKRKIPTIQLTWAELDRQHYPEYY